MIDFHSHILPSVDDGCKGAAESIEALKMLKASGIDKVMLTPHYYARNETADEFIARREKAYEILKNEINRSSLDLPELCLGAEVNFFYGISHFSDIKKLCYENTKCMLLELPFAKWSKSVYTEVRNLQGRLGITPLLAHINRYTVFGNSFDDILSLGCPLQLNAEVFESIFRKKKWLNYLRKTDMVLGSDCHNLSSRKPNIDKAVYAISTKLGISFIDKIENMGNMLINT